MKNINTQMIGITLLRLALAFVFLWFGFSQLSDAAMWTSFVPDWAVKLSGMGAGTLVLFNGFIEVLGGIALALGIFTRLVAALLGIHLFIIAASLGANAIAIRDMGLSLATLSLAFIGGGSFTLTGRSKVSIVQDGADTSTILR